MLKKKRLWKKPPRSFVNCSSEMKRFKVLFLFGFLTISFLIKAQNTLLKKLEIKSNSFYFKEQKTSRTNLLSLIQSDLNMLEVDKTKWLNNIEKFYDYRSKKRTLFPLAFSTLALGSISGYLSTLGEAKNDVKILSAIFGGASVAITTGGIINCIKFKKKKRELQKQLLLE